MFLPVTITSAKAAKGYNGGMNKQKQQTVLLGITGSIAAYKACELLRLLQKEGARVKVLMTKHAQELVGAATFRALSGEPVASDLFEDPSSPLKHISLAEEADAFVIAPCTANMLNKLANGVADDLLTTTALACKAPLVLAPAMNVKMLHNEHTQDSLRVLEAAGASIVGPGKGYLACGDEDTGRMSEPEDICAATLRALAYKKSMSGKRVLITAGPTREYIDPVRFISSPSSGRTGFALASEAHARGAEVVLVSGPIELLTPLGVQYVPVVSAEDMLVAAGKHFDNADIAIFSAAVADFRPEQRTEHKLKKGIDLPQDHAAPLLTKGKETENSYDLTLTANPDILKTLAARRNTAKVKKPYVVGFAAETENLLAHARTKLETKGADLIIANDVSKPHLGFASTHNKLSFVSTEERVSTEVLSKNDLAGVIFDMILNKLC